MGFNCVQTGKRRAAQVFTFTFVPTVEVMSVGGGGAGFKVIYFSIYCVTRPQYGDFNIFISDNKAKQRPTSAEL